MKLPASRNPGFKVTVREIENVHEHKKVNTYDLVVHVGKGKSRAIMLAHALDAAIKAHEGIPANDTAAESFMPALTRAMKKARSEGRDVEINCRSGMVECEPANNYVRRRATGEKFINIYIGPNRWKEETA